MIGLEKDRMFFLRRGPLILTALSVLVVLAFLAVTGLSHVFDSQQVSLGTRWFDRGSNDLKAGHYKQAVSDLRTALLYSRDDFTYQLDLAEALIGDGRYAEASAYLENLWDRQPENGVVNLELARIAAKKGDRDQALRYYHNAVYATWTANQMGSQSGSQDVERRNARLELVQYLLSINDRAQVQSELIALAANLGDNPAERMHVGDLFFQVQDYQDALTQYELALKSEPHNPAALAGSGRAAFELGRYGPAERYLEDAVAAAPKDAQLEAQLKDAELAVRMDPYRRQISFAQRSGIVMDAFAAAGQRLQSCPAAGGAASSGVPVQSTDGKQGSAEGTKAAASTAQKPGVKAQKPAAAAGQSPAVGQTPIVEQSLSEQWTKMKPQITERGMRRNPELVEAAMELVFEIERQSNAKCGAPSGIDMALLRISKLHMSN